MKSFSTAAAGLLALALAATTGATAQTTADSALRSGTPADSARAYAPPSGVSDSSAAAAAAPAAPGAPGTGAQPPSSTTSTIVTRVAPPDTTLARACAGAPPGSEAPGLLAVVFRPGTPDKERDAAARAVGGTLGGPTDYGEEYVRVPDGAGSLAAVADRLIRQVPVTRVSPAPCPAPTPTAVPAPTAPTAVPGVPGTVPDTARGTAPAAAPGTAPGAASTGTPPRTAGDTAPPAPTMSP